MPQRATRPNLLFVFADQMRGMDLGCAGNPDVLTPHLDRLAAQGILSRRAYATIPVCGPNRACLLTGALGPRHRVLRNDQPLPLELPTLGTVFRDAGYRTGYIGKWHLDGMPREKFTPPGDRRGGFDHFWAVHNCTHEYLTPRFYRDLPQMIHEPGYEPEVQTNLALEFLGAAATDPRPFCLALSFGPPHNPYEQVPEACRRRYDPDRLRLRQNCKIIPRQELDPAWTHRATTADYYALITSLDDQMGRLLARLDQLQLSQDTLVIFTADHGEMLWSQGLLYKCVPYEESVNVPLLWRWPRGLAPGRTDDTLIGTIDLLPTLCGLFGLPCPPTSQGQNLAPALTQAPGAAIPSSVLIGYYERYTFRPDMPVTEWRGVRTPRYTYTERLDRKPWLAFDNERDPFQMTNLALDPRFDPLLKELAGELHRKLAEAGDPFLSIEEMTRRFPPAPERA